MDVRRQAYKPGSARSNMMKSLRQRRPQKKSFERTEEYLDIQEVKDHLAKNFSEASNGHYQERSLFLNTLNRQIYSTETSSLNDPSFFEDLCRSITTLLKDDHSSIRAMCFCILTKTFFNERNLVVLLKSHVDIYVLRAIDICADNERERSEAFKLVRKMITIFRNSKLKELYDSAAKSEKKSFAFPMSIMQPIISIALYAISIPANLNGKDFEVERDRLAAPCVGLFFEFCLVEPMLVYKMAGTDWMVRILKGESEVSKKLSHVVAHILAAWLDSPDLRREASLQSVLEQILAPLVELGLFYRRESEMEKIPSRLCDFLETFRYSFLRLMRSWTGIFACAAVGPDFELLPTSPLRLLEHLGLGTVENDSLQTIREMVIDICCDFIDAPYANVKFTQWDQALEFYETMRWKDTYKKTLKNDFVLEQHKMAFLQDPKYSSDVDLASCFRSLALFILVNASLPQSLARLILSNPDCGSSLKATLLMSDLLKLAPAVVPSGWRASVVSVPSLFQAACEAVAKCKAAAAIHGNVEELEHLDGNNYTFVHSENALLALHRLDELNTAWIRASATPSIPPMSHLAIFTHHPPPIVPLQPMVPVVLKEAIETKQQCFLTYDKRQFLLNDLANNIDDFDYSTKPFEEESGDSLHSLLSTCIVTTAGIESISWEQMILAVKRLENSENVRQTTMLLMLEVCSKMIMTISPREKESYQFTPSKASTAKTVIQMMLKLTQADGAHSHDFKLLLDDYARKCYRALKNKDSSKSPFNARCLEHTTAMYHFALLGAYTTTEQGVNMLTESGILHLFLDTMTSEAKEEHVKVVISSLSYALNGLPRIILEAALTRTDESCRRWATRFVAVIAAQSLPAFEDWGIKLMLGQLADTSVKVVRQAVRLLLYWIPKYPTSVKQLNQTAHWDVFGDAGVMLRANVFTDEQIFNENRLEAENFVKFWMNIFNKRYMKSVEEDLCTALLGVRRSIEGGFSRSSGERPEYAQVQPPMHLLQAVASHSSGRRLLNDLNIPTVLLKSLRSDPEDVKAALLALAAIGATDDGFAILPEKTIPKMLRLAEGSQILSVRGMAFCALNLMAQSEKAARAVTLYGWESNLHRNLLTEVKISAERQAGRRRVSSRSRTRGSSVPEIDADWTRPKANSFAGDPLPGRIQRRRRSAEERRHRAATSTPRKLTRTSSDVVLDAISEARVTSDSSSDEQGSYTRPDSARAMRSHTVLTFDSMSTSSLADPSSCLKLPPTPSTPSSRLRSLTATSTAEDAVKTRSTVVAKCLSDGLSVSKAQLEIEAVKADTLRDAHFSSSIRQSYGLAPIFTRKFLQVRRNVADTLQYVFMTKDEERHFSEYRRILMNDGWLWSEFRREDEQSQRAVNAVVVRPVVLPAELTVICQNIFPVPCELSACADLHHHHHCAQPSETEPKITFGPQRISIKQPHTACRCFFCANEGGPIWRLPVDVATAAALRAEVLAQVDMLEIKETLPERRLLRLRESYKWLFEWPCLYADVLELLDEFRFKPSSRSFLQQIFYGALLL